MRYSIITINYNNKLGLRKTIESVVQQTCNDYEYIIIDGGSKDGSVDVINIFKDQIDYWVSETDRGIYPAMNKGVSRAQGDYCIFMNSGDCFYKETVLERISLLEEKDDIIVGRVISNNDQLLFSPPTRDISLYYLYSGTVPHQSSFIKTELLRKYPYDENLKIVSDWKFYVQAIIEGNCTIRFVNELVARFDMDGVSTTNPDKMWVEKMQVLSEMFPPRVIADYRHMKDSECHTQTLTPELRKSYCVDKILFIMGKLLLRLKNK